MQEKTKQSLSDILQEVYWKLSGVVRAVNGDLKDVTALGWVIERACRIEDEGESQSILFDSYPSTKESM